MKNNFLYPVSVSGTTLLCDRDLIELVRQKGGDQLAEVLANRLSHEKNNGFCNLGVKKNDET